MDAELKQKDDELLCELVITSLFLLSAANDHCLSVDSEKRHVSANGCTDGNQNDSI